MAPKSFHHSSDVASRRSGSVLPSLRLLSAGSSRISTPGPTGLDARPLGNTCTSWVSKHGALRIAGSIPNDCCRVFLTTLIYAALSRIHNSHSHLSLPSPTEKQIREPIVLRA